jgi:hypothetical protein
MGGIGRQERSIVRAEPSKALRSACLKKNPPQRVHGGVVAAA